MPDVYYTCLGVTYLLVGIAFLVWIIFVIIDMVRDWRKDDTKR